MYCDSFEADLRQYYNVNLRDLFDEESDISPRFVVVLLNGLPQESRLFQLVGEGAYTLDQNLMVDIHDSLIQILYQTSISAAVGAGKEYQKVMRQKPKPIERPGPKPIVPKKTFTKPSALKGMLSSRKVSISHTEACVASRINEGGGALKCSCPPKS